jgi:hypothetical protein
MNASAAGEGCSPVQPLLSPILTLPQPLQHTWGVVVNQFNNNLVVEPPPDCDCFGPGGKHAWKKGKS